MRFTSTLLSTSSSRPISRIVCGDSGSSCDIVYHAIGNTPLVRLGGRIHEHLRLPPNTCIYAKLENLSIGGSKKDRIARQILFDARKDGTLKPGQRVVELTSGNTGTGLAIVSAALGHPFTAVMSRGNTDERAKMMQSLGAHVVLVDQRSGDAAMKGQVSGSDLELVEEETRRIVREGGGGENGNEPCFRADQFALAGSFRAHYLTTGPECWTQSGGRIDAFVDFVGTGGTFVGISKYLKEVSDGNIRCYIVEPSSCVVLDPSINNLQQQQCANGRHKIQGGGYSKTFDELSLFDEAVSGVHRDLLIDGYLQVTDEEAIETARLLAKTEGIFGGFSSGANVAAAAKVIKSGQGKNVLAIICDSGLKYLSTDLYNVRTTLA